MANVEISVCIITYNQHRYIRQCVQSVLMQECDVPFEVIVSDDGSTDGTFEVLQAIAREDVRVKIIRSVSNRGVKKNLFSTLSEASGEFIALLEGDDYWCDRKKLKLQYEALKRNPHAHLCATSVQTEIEFFGIRRVREIRPLTMSCDDIRAKILAGSLMLHTCTFFCTKLLIDRHIRSPIFREDLLSGDGPLLTHAAFLGEIVYFPVCTASYRITRGSLMNSGLDTRVRLIIETLDWHFAYRQYFGSVARSDDEVVHNIKSRMLDIGYVPRHDGKIDLEQDLRSQFVFSRARGLLFRLRRTASQLRVWLLGSSPRIS